MNLKVKSLLSLSVVACAITFTACGGSDSSAPAQPAALSAVTVQAPADYATRSHDSYSDNTYGVITPEKAAALITDWQKNKPAGKRKLFVMQFGSIYGFSGTHIEVTTDGNVTTNNGYIKSNPSAGVYVFDRTSGCTSTNDFRFDGVTNMPKPVFDIQQMNDAFATYGIDPEQDVIMLALGSESPTSAGEYMAGVARMWYTLTYWGFPQSSILMLDGQAANVLNPDVNPAIAKMGIARNDIFTSLPATSPVTNTTWKSIKNIRVDGTILQATMKDMMNLVTTASPSDLILDARSAAEYNGSGHSATEYSVCGAAHNQQCYTAFEGHIKGAKNLTFSNLLIMNDGTKDLNGDGVIDYKDSTMQFKSVKDIEALFANAGYTPGKNIYTYCRTGTKASLVSFASSAILGYKTRMFDGSWIQWGRLASKPDTNGNLLVPAGNKWLTDAYSESVVYTDQLLVAPLNQKFLNLNAADANLIVYTDKNSK